MDRELVIGVAGDLRRLRCEVQAALSAAPGVVGVGFGDREKGGEDKSTHVMRVYFASKEYWTDEAAEAVLARSRRVHRDIEVLVHAGAGVACTSTPVLYPGDQIARDIDTNANESYGTLGLIVLKEGQTGRYLLTNYHVLPAGAVSALRGLKTFTSHTKPHATSQWPRFPQCPTRNSHLIPKTWFTPWPMPIRHIPV